MASMHYFVVCYQLGELDMKVPCKSKQAPFEFTLKVIGGKWKMKIIYQLASCQILRFNEIKRNIPEITYKMLSTQLKELEADGVVVRTEYPQIPPKVEYALSERGLSLIPVLNEMCEWGATHSNNSLK